MKTKLLAIAGIVAIGLLISCSKNLVTYQQGDMKVFIEKGDNWLHDFPLFMGIKLKNSPQIAIWIEDPAGNYLSTIYVSRKIATEGWISNGGDRRKEALPVWCYARGVQYPDGLYLPTKEDPLADGLTGATPKESFNVKIRPSGDQRQFVVKIEVNHSTDWNEAYPENAKDGDMNYSGDSGQPALIYSVAIDLDSTQKQYTATLIGHSSPDGTNGDIYPDTSSLTSALDIINEITINIQ